MILRKIQVHRLQAAPHQGVFSTRPSSPPVLSSRMPSKLLFFCFSYFYLLRLLYLSPLPPGLHTTFPHSTYATEGVTLQHIGGIGIICIC